MVPFANKDDTQTDTASSRSQKIRKRTALAVALAVVLLAPLTLQIPAVGQWTLTTIVRQFVPDGSVFTVSSVRGTWVTGLTVTDLHFSLSDRPFVIEADTLEVRYRLVRSLIGVVTIDRLRAVEPTIVARADTAPTEDPTQPALGGPLETVRSLRQIEIGLLDITRGVFSRYVPLALADSVLRINQVTVRARHIEVGPTLAASIDTLAFGFLPSGEENRWASVTLRGEVNDSSAVVNDFRLQSPNSEVIGRGSVPLIDTDSLDVIFSAHPLAYQDIRPFVPGFQETGSLQADLRITGTTQYPQLDVDIQFADGATANATGRTTRHPIQGRLTQFVARITGVNPALITGQAKHEGTVNAVISADLTGADFRAVDGTASVTLDKSRFGTFESSVARLDATFEDGTAQLDGAARLNDMHINIDGWIEPFDSMPRYDVRGIATGFPGTLEQAARWHESLGASTANISGHIRGHGVRDDVEFDLTGALTALASNRTVLDSVRGTLKWKPEGGVFTVNSGLASGTITLAGSLATDRGLSYSLSNGEFNEINIAALLGDTTTSSVTGSFRGRGRGSSAESVALDANLEIHSARYGEYVADSGTVHMAMRSGVVMVNGSTNALGGNLRLSGSARPFNQPFSFAVDTLMFEQLDVGMIFRGVGRSSGHINAAGQGNLWTAVIHALSGDPVDGRDSVTFDAHIVIDSSQFGRTSIKGGELILGLSDGELVGSAQTSINAGQVSFQIRGSPLDSIPSLRVEDGWFHNITSGDSSPAGALTGSFTAQVMDGRTKHLRSKLDVIVDSVTIANIHIEAGDAAFELDRDELRISSNFTTDMGPLHIQGTGSLLDGRPVYHFVSGSNLETLEPLTGITGHTGNIAIRTIIDGAGFDPTSLRLDMTLEAKGTLANAVLDSARTTARIENGLVWIDTLFLQSSIGDVSAIGTLPFFAKQISPRSRFQMTGAAHDVIVVDDATAENSFVLRSGTFDIVTNGLSDSLVIDVNVAATGAVWQGGRVGDVLVNATATTNGYHAIQHAHGRLGIERALSGAIPMDTGALTVTYDQESQFLVDGTANFGLDRELRFAGEWDPRPHQQRIRMGQLSFDLHGDLWRLTRPTDVRYGGVFSVDSLGLQAGRQRIWLNGMSDREGIHNLELRFDSVRTRTLAILLGLPPMSGNIHVTASLSGDATSPLLHADAHATMTSSQSSNLDLSANMNWTPDGLRLDAGVANGVGDSLIMTSVLPVALGTPRTGSVPSVLPTDGTTEVVLSADSFEIGALTLLVPPSLATAIRGTLVSNVRLEGSNDSTVLTGTLSILDGNIRLPTLGVSYDDIDVAAVLAGDSVWINTAHLGSAGGTLDADGTIRMDGWRLGSMRIRGELERFKAMETDYDIRASGSVQLEGTLDEPRFSGQLVLEDTDLFWTRSNAVAGIETVELTDADLAMLEEQFGYDVFDRFDVPLTELYDRLAVDLDIVLNPNVWLRSQSDPKMAVELAGSIAVEKAPGATTRMTGTVEPRTGQGYLQQFGRRFELSGGSVTLNGDVDSANVNLQATYQVPDRSGDGSAARITMEITGHTRDLRLTFSSEPEMSEADIISYIATGGPASQGFQVGETAAEAGLVLAFERVSGAVERIAAEGVGLDVVEIQTDGSRGTTLVAGRYVGPTVWVAFRQPISPSDKTTDVSGAAKRPEFEIEYRAFRTLLLNLQGGADRFRVFLRWRNAY